MKRAFVFALGCLTLAIGCADASKSFSRTASSPAGVPERQGVSGEHEDAGPSGKPAFHTNVLRVARDNDAYRRVLFTGARSQLFVMSIPPRQDTGVESRPNVEQLIFVVSGQGKASIDGADSALSAGDVLVVPAGARHDVVNTGTEPLRIYTVSVPPSHIDGRVQQTKAEAWSDSADEVFGRSVR